jgi:hypothetical protein
LYAPVVVAGGLTLTIDQFSGGMWTQNTVTFPAQPGGYYDYQNYSSNHAVEGNIMGIWDTSAGDSGNAFDLRLDLSVDGNPDHDVHSNVVTILVDNTAPVAKLSIDLGGECGDFSPGQIFTGKYTATDDDFGSFQFVILPPGPANGVLPVPSSGASVYLGGGILDPGVNDQTYTLDTTGMAACGYSMTVQVWDRTNVNSGQTNNFNEASVGFCLRVK